MINSKPTTIDEYIACFEGETRKALQQVRETIRKAVPNAEETISYAIPCYKLNGHYLIYFAGYKNHIGLYPIPTEDAAIKSDIKGYKTSGKGTLQLPLNQPIPVKLVAKIAGLMVKKNMEKATKKQAAVK